MPFKPTTTTTTSHEPEPEVHRAEVVDDKTEANPVADERDLPPLLHTAAEFLGRAAVATSRLDAKKGAKVAVAAATVGALAHDADAIVDSGRALIDGGKRMFDKYAPVVKKALTPGLEQRAIVDMHRDRLRGGSR